MTRTSISINVQAPVEKVFAAISDIETFPGRAEAITAVEFLTDQKTGVGTRFRETRLMKGRENQTELEVTEYIENERIRMVADQGGTIWDTVFTVVQSDSGTKLDMTMDARPYKWVAKFMTPLIRGMVEKFVQKDMDELKAWCEASEG